MKLVSFTLLLCLLVSTSAFLNKKEQKKGDKDKKGGGQSCSTQYVTEYSSHCEDTYKEVCSTEYTQGSCHETHSTGYRDDCHTSYTTRCSHGSSDSGKKEGKGKKRG